MKERIAIDREVAEAEFDRFVEAMDLDLDPSTMDKEDGADFTRLRDSMVRAIEKGAVLIHETTGEPIFLPTKDLGHDTITFYEPTGASLMATDGKGKHADVRKMFAMMSDMTRTSPGTFASMPSRDLKICQNIVTLFLA